VFAVGDYTEFKKTHQFKSWHLSVSSGNIHQLLAKISKQLLECEVEEREQEAYDVETTSLGKVGVSEQKNLLVR